jgi:hypothetical protein
VKQSSELEKIMKTPASHSREYHLLESTSLLNRIFLLVYSETAVAAERRSNGLHHIIILHLKGAYIPSLKAPKI